MATAEPARPVRVLVVEDDEHIRAIIHATLSDCGHEVHEAPNGAAALEVVERMTPDAIVLDMNMPVMDGWAFAHAYRQRPGPHAPIIVTTAAGNVGFYGAALSAYPLAKPFDLDDLCGAVAAAVSERAAA